MKLNPFHRELDNFELSASRLSEGRGEQHQREQKSGSGISSTLPMPSDRCFTPGARCVFNRIPPSLLVKQKEIEYFGTKEIEEQQT